MRIALSMLDQVWENKQKNLDACSKQIEIASKNKADLIIFPEMTLTGFTLNTKSVSEENNESKSIQEFSIMADANSISVVAGLVLKKNNLFYNSAIAISEHGKILAQYSKIHPFTFAGEDKYITGGDKLSIFKIKKIRFGLTICYDLRFPSLWSVLADKCDCIVNIANWPVKKIDHWHTLLKARAIENQIYVLGVNRVGKDGNGLEYIESSCAYSPEGVLMDFMTSGKDVIIVDIDLSMVRSYQDSFPVKNDRKNNVYKELLGYSTKL